jgi:Dyp-type peroxidase family
MVRSIVEAINLDLNDIQGLILRGYTMPVQRHVVLRIEDARAARRGLSRLVSGDATVPQITSAAPWPEKPPFTLSLGFTYEGLKALGVSPESLASFPEEFRRGAGDPVTAQKVGYTGESDPAQWVDALAWNQGQPSEAHVLLFISAQDTPTREAGGEELRALLAEEGGVRVLAMFDGAELPEHRVHFGYVDGLAQPHIAGGPPSRIPDNQPPAPPGEFLLGYESQYPGFAYPVPTPCTLGKNGSFAAYGIVRQEVDAFENFLKQAAQETGKSAEWVAAKLCGRWRNGVPLSLSPETDTPDPPIPLEQWNQFDYIPTPDDPDGFDDSRGLRCPIGSHIRRINPRSGRVAGNGGHLHRVIRRGIPYGPVYDPKNPNDGIERGLLGMFICVSLKDQFEFLMSEWVNGDSFGLLGDRDPLAGNNDSGPRRLRIPVADRPKPLVLNGLTRFLTTRGSAYCFLPSLTALRYLASVETT